MNPKILVSVVAVIAVILALGVALGVALAPETDTRPVIYPGFTYYDIEGIQSILAEQNIRVTVPVAITDNTIGMYCMIPGGSDQYQISYCTTTAVLDPDGESLGNINLGGNEYSPAVAIAILETDLLDYEQSGVLVVFEAMIETLVCDCWEQIRPGGIGSVGEWLDSAVSHYSGSESRTLKANIDGLEGNRLILEITPKDGSVLWVLYIIK